MVTTGELKLSLISKLNKAKEGPIRGIRLKLLLPAHIDTARILPAISPLKDVDRIHRENVDSMVQGSHRFLLGTPMLLENHIACCSATGTSRLRRALERMHCA